MLRTYLKARMPDYMLPAAFVMLHALPLTPNGKVDRGALPAPDPTKQTESITSVPPRTPLEDLIADIWRDILKIERIGMNDNFFVLGGHSLLATRVIARLRQVLELALPLRTIFEHPTVGQLAQTIDTQLSRTYPDWPTNERPTQS
jgi:acyl carrier protein